MQITHELSIDAPLERVWPVITDPARAVAALPGATLDEVDGDIFRGSLGVKLGPMNLRYAGEGKLQSDLTSHEVVIDGKGTEQRGSGGVSASITARLSELPAQRTGVVVDIDLDLTGKPAQFGRGILSEVAKRLAGSFVKRLEQIVNAEDTTAVVSQPTKVTAAPEPLAAGGSMFGSVRSYLPAAAAVTGLVAGGVLLRRVLRTSAVPRVIVVIAQDPQQAAEAITRALR